MGIIKVKEYFNIFFSSKILINCVVCGVDTYALIDTGAVNFVITKKLIDEIRKFEKTVPKDNTTYFRLTENKNEVVPLLGFNESMPRVKSKEELSSIYVPKLNYIHEGSLLLGRKLDFIGVPYVGTREESEYGIIIPYTFLSMIGFDMHKEFKDSCMRIEFSAIKDESRPLVIKHNLENGKPTIIYEQKNISEENSKRNSLLEQLES